MTVEPSRRGTADHKARWRWLAVVAALAAIGAATLTPQLPTPNLPPWYQPFTGSGDLADALLNIGLFVPLGIALAIARVPRDRALVTALVTTVAIELLQGLVIPGRQASIADVLMNVLGGWLGHAIAGWTVAAACASARDARRLALDYAVVWLLTAFAGAAMLRPALPIMAGAYRGRCGVGDQPPCFPGQLAGPALLRQPGRADFAIVEGATTPVGRQPTLLVDIVDGGVAARQGRIVGVSTTPGGALLMLDQRSDWLLFMARTQGANWGLRSPAVVLRGVLGRRGRHVAATAGVTGNTRWLAADGQRAELRLSAAEWWRLFFPWSAAGEHIIVTVGALFHAITLLPMGFWLARVARGSRREDAGAAAGAVDVRAVAWAVAGALALAEVGLAGGGAVLALAPIRVADWMGAACGAFAGALLAGRVGVPRAEPTTAGRVAGVTTAFHRT